MAAFDDDRGFEWDEDDKPREECAVFGVFGDADAPAVTALGLHALQHRGQEATGIAAFDGARFRVEKRLGLVGENFSAGKMPKDFHGRAAIGHNRYSTTEAGARNIQPLYADLANGGFAIAHNGNLTNALTLRDGLIREGAIFQSTSDTEVIIQLTARSKKELIADRFVDAIGQVEGGYALLALTNKKLMAARDPAGIRPLVMGKRGEAIVFASETCALDAVGADFVREVEPGEVVIVTAQGVESRRPFPAQQTRPCVFEFIYFARPDSVIDGRSVYEARKEMGRRLAQETGVDADVVVPVPDSGVPAALGYAEAAGLPFEYGLVRSHYVGRSFIQPSQSSRDRAVSLKHYPNRAVLAGKRVLLVDDSIVRGTTSKKIVRLVRQAGAREVHLRSASPPIRFGDYYGVDLPDSDNLLAANHDLEGMRQIIGADSLGFLSVDGLYQAMGYEKRDDNQPKFSDHCFTGDYPTGLVDRDRAQDAMRQLSLLAESA